MTADLELHTEGEPLFEALQVWHGFLLRKAGQRFGELADQALQPLSLTLRQFGVLNVVVAEPGLNQRSVGSKLRIDRTTIVGLIDDLERNGLVERRRGTDRRTFALHVTERGAKTLDRASDEITRVHERFLGALSPGERGMLRELLSRLVGSESPAAG
ncbi:MarR family winged helix-turn-helix transcriptional regulator [Streptacidiphilus rugosus]|uniref:MarR family winged helix-turn-helix transcriptional regulator n=1 Tax=Streptacidiphilus rugosus TaxID=405783 RepID=UPI00068E53E7|nr:MarR family transcriptional regulator [Streptacidiphilus rugosus]